MFPTEQSKKTLSLPREIGDYKVFSIPTGLFGLDGGAMFGTVPKALWSRSQPADDQNRIRMQARVLCLQSKTRVILVDCGNGDSFVEKYGEKLGAKFSALFGIEENSGMESELLVRLAQAGIQPEDVTDVLLTHLHFDHAGGGVCYRNGRLVPTFSRAKYWIQKGNLETARNPNLRERASYLKANFEILEAAGVLRLLEGPQENWQPGIHVRIFHGHTRFQQLPLVTDGQRSLFYCGDLIATSSHVRLPWVMGYDLDPLLVIEEKRKLLTEAALKSWYLFLEHDPDWDAVSVRGIGGKEELPSGELAQKNLGKGNSFEDFEVDGRFTH